MPAIRIGSLVRFDAYDVAIQCGDVVGAAAELCERDALKNGDRPGVYAVADGEYFKIGRAARSMRERLANLQIGNPRELRLLAILSLDPNDERALHSEFSAFHVRGEWYRMTEQSLAMVKAREARGEAQ